MMEVLKDACDAARANPSFQPHDGKTFCNLGAMFVAAAFGCVELQGLTADEMYDKMFANVTGKWTRIIGTSAAQNALSGRLVFAAASSGMLGEDHGHIAPCYPEAMEFSGSLNRFVPMLSNIGKTVGVMKSSQAFPVDKGEANYFLYG